jgi:hypothetical protein
MMYCAEAMTPKELKFKSPRAENNSTQEADESMVMDLLRDYRVEALGTITKYQEEIKTWRDKSIKTKEFDKGNLVLI